MIGKFIVLRLLVHLFIHYHVYPTKVQSNQLIVPETIPYITSSERSSAQLTSREWYDTEKIRNCFRHKNILILGDSTMIETVHDLVILLSGVGSSRDSLDDYVNAATHIRGEVKMKLNPDLLVEFHGNHRKMNIYSKKKLNMTITYRFTGHHDIGKNFGGIKSFLSHQIQDELAYLLGRNGGIVPDIVIFNSGAHDIRWVKSDFQPLIYQALTEAAVSNIIKLLSPSSQDRLYWKGNLCYPRDNQYSTNGLLLPFRYNI